jgi:hypothetical protein
LQTATAGAGEKPLHKAQGDAVGKTKGGGNDDKCASASRSDDHYDALLRVTGEREESLEKALKDSPEWISNLNIRSNNAEPGSCSIDGWVKKYVSNELGDKSDEAIAALEAVLTNSASVDSVLGLKRGNATDDSLKKAFVSAGEAIEAEFELLRSDALGEFPCTALISSGRHLLETWQAESAAIKGLFAGVSHARRGHSFERRVPG